MIDLEFINEVAIAAAQAERYACILVIERFLAKDEPWSWDEVIEAIKERGELK